MIPPQFEYVRPPDVDTVLQILADRAGEAKILAGGYSLLPLLKLRLGQPALLVDIQDLSGLAEIHEKHGQLRIGGRATHRAIATSDLVRDRYPLLAETAAGIGDPQVRNWGTLAGSLAHADPASDWPAVLIAAHGWIVCRSTIGEREVAAREWCIDTFTTAIEPTELITQIRIAEAGPRSGGAYEKLERRTGDFATAGAAVALRLDAAGRLEEVGIGLTGVANAPFAAVEAERLARGQEPTEALIRHVGAAAAAASQPVADVRGPVEFKRAMVAEMTRRAFNRAVERARANS